MKTECVVGLAEALPEPVCLHRPRAEHPFLGRLHDQDELAAPFVGALGHLPRRANQARDVHIVTAGMHRVDQVARDRVFLLLARGVLESRFFLDRQAVHVGAHHHRRAIAVFQHGNDAGAADVLGHVEARDTQLLGHALRGFRLDERQLGIAMKVVEQRPQIRVVIFLNGVAQFGRGDGNGQHGKERHYGETFVHGSPRGFLGVIGLV